MHHPQSAPHSSSSTFMHTFPRNHPQPQSLRTTASGIEQSPVRCCGSNSNSNPASAHNTQRRKTVTFLETIECPGSNNIPGKQSGTNSTLQHHSEVDDFPL